MTYAPWRGYVKYIVAEYPNLTGELTMDQLRKKSAVEAAIEAAKTKRHAELRLKLIEMVFWRATHTVGGAAMLIPCHVNTARTWQNEFLTDVAKALDLP